MSHRVSAVETSQTLGRGLRVLELLADAPDGRTVSDLAADLGVGRTVVYRLLATLEEYGLVRRDTEGRARLALGVLRLARAVHPLLRAAALPELRRLAETVGLTASLSILEGSEVLAVAVVEPSWTDFHVAYREGTRHPRERGAAGRAIGASGRGSSRWASSSRVPTASRRRCRSPGSTRRWASSGLSAIDETAVGPQVVAAAAGDRGGVDQGQRPVGDRGWRGRSSSTSARPLRWPRAGR